MQNHGLNSKLYLNHIIKTTLKKFYTSDSSNLLEATQQVVDARIWKDAY